jgi:hypothetical protein
MLSTQLQAYPPHPSFRTPSLTLASAVDGCTMRNRRT